MSSLSRELVFLILQFLDEEKFKETVHKQVILISVYGFSSFVYMYLPAIFSFCSWDQMDNSISTLRILEFFCGNRLEQESGFYFNMKYFEEEVHNGNWDEVEKYLSGFTKVDDNRYSMKIFFEIRKQKYLEALDK